MRSFSIATLALCSLLTVACANSADHSSGNASGESVKGGYVLKGKLQNLNAGQVYLEELGPLSFTIKDTATIGTDGKFSFTGKVNEPTIYKLTVADKGAIMMVLENKEIQVEADAANQFTNPTYKGSKESENIQELNNLMIGAQARINDLNQRYGAAQGNPEAMKAIEQEFAGVQAKSSEEIKEFIRKKPNSIIGVYAAANLLNTEQDLAFADEMGAVYKKNLPNSQYTKQLEAKLNKPRPVGEGSQAPDIKLPSPDGKEIALSSLRGKYVLIDFWASWCGPCRKENPNVVRLYNQYKNKNFEIYGVSLDQSKDKWVNAIAADNLTWLHVSDLKGWQSSAGQLYGVNSIPATFLIDPQGKVIAKNLRGKALEDKVAELLKK